MQAPLQREYPASQAQAPQAQEALHDAVPLVSHGSVAPGVHAPAGMEHADQVSVPSLHVAVCVPQLPHERVVEPAHVHLPLAQLEPEGHTWPQAPQLLASVPVMLVQTPEHVV
jgi:hypothetical protein